MTKGTLEDDRVKKLLLLQHLW